jgi:hypothetical protein
MKQGKMVPVRLGSGEVAVAVYDHAAQYGKGHWVRLNGEPLQACDSPIGGLYFRRCRFVGPPCVLVPVPVGVVV